MSSTQFLTAPQDIDFLSPILRHRGAGLLFTSRQAGTGGPNLIELRKQWLQLVVEPASVGVVLRSRSQQRPSRVISKSGAYILRHTVEGRQKSSFLSDTNLNRGAVTVETSKLSKRWTSKNHCWLVKIPALGRVFNKTRISGRYHFTCMYHATTCISNEIIRRIKHVRRCPITDEEMIGSAYRQAILQRDLRDANTQRNDDWVDVMLGNNIPLASFGSRSSERFIKTHASQWHVASRHQISCNNSCSPLEAVFELIDL